MISKKQPQKANRKSQAWSIPDNMATPREICNELEKLIPNLTETCDNKNLELRIFSIFELQNKNDNYLFREMMMNNERRKDIFYIVDIFWHYKKDILINILLMRLGLNKPIKISAHDITIKPDESTKVINDFINKYHIYGTRPSSIKLGLYYKEELIGIATYGVPYSGGNVHKADLEFHRFAFKPEYACRGLLDKVYKYVFDNYNCQRILEYKDNMLFNKASRQMAQTGTTWYFVINDKFYTRTQAMNIKDLKYPLICYDKIGLPGSSIEIIYKSTEDMF